MFGFLDSSINLEIWGNASAPNKKTRTSKIKFDFVSEIFKGKCLMDALFVKTCEFFNLRVLKIDLFCF